VSEPLVQTPGTLRPLLRLATPVLIEQMLGILVWFSDRLLVGHYFPIAHQAAITLMAYLLWLIYGLFSTVGIGATAMVARYVGAGNYKMARHVTEQAFILGAIVAVMVTGLGALFAERMVYFFQLEGPAADHAVVYFRYMLPVIPLIMMRLIDHSKRPGGHPLASGLAFCAGVILFFAAFALVSAIISLTTGAVLDLNSLFRYPSAVIVLFLAIVFFALAMLDVVVLSLPSSIAGKQGGGSGLLGTAGMGFFAGVLSTPCSGALLGFVLVWAQTQPLLVSSTAIVLMGVGMALPYAVIVSIPSLLDRIPKPGTWMEIFKKSTGFLLFLIAAKLTLAALPNDRLMNVLMYGIIFSFCVWMWGKWVGFATPPAKRRLVRGIALLIAVGTGLWLLPAVAKPEGATIQWQDYNADLIGSAVSQKRPVVVKFTADWCTNCKVVERRVYHDPEVVQLIAEKNVLPIKADTTVIDYPATVDLKGTYGEAGNVPVTIVLLPDGTQQKLRGIFAKETLTDILTPLPEGQ